MKRPLPKRPSVEEFVGAAQRYTRDDYKPEDEVTAFVVNVGYFAYASSMPKQRIYDIDVIEREQAAEGLAEPGGSLEDFAVHQLAAYRRLARSQSDEQNG